ncbi:hypothetical protein PROFUN_05810 [Planoprotostelium fungivorum]|uniref:Swt1-like HEPN domain-containing protein n=1 Tax=Planoprotostelium fungivorum TaxID=1890364 RepID=A0A2P6NQ18_9EUKA|nr:hypothetical protein PROFUN_05810 [Planoprotostelium fungivorum]
MIQPAPSVTPHSHECYVKNMASERQDNSLRISRCLDHFNEGVRSYLALKLSVVFGAQWFQIALKYVDRRSINKNTTDLSRVDTTALIAIIFGCWKDLIELQPQHRTLLHEIRHARNRWAHQEDFSLDDSYRIIDNMERLLGYFGEFPLCTAIRDERHALILAMADRILQSRTNQTPPPTSVYTSTLAPDVMDIDGCKLFNSANALLDVVFM